MTGVAVRIALQVILMLGLRLPERTNGLHFRHHLAGPDARSIDIGNRILGYALLRLVLR